MILDFVQQMMDALVARQSAHKNCGLLKILQYRL